MGFSLFEFDFYLLVNLWLIGNWNIDNIVGFVIILAISESIVQDLDSFVAKFCKFLIYAKKLVPQIFMVETETNAETDLFFGWSLGIQGYMKGKLGNKTGYFWSCGNGEF